MLEKFYLYKVVSGKDVDSFGKIYDLYIDKIYRFIFFKVKSAEEAQDLTSEVFLKAWQYLSGPAGKTISNINAFLYKLARNSVIDFYRRQKNNVELNEAIEVEDKNMAVPEAVDIKNEWQNLMSSLNQLKDEYREVLLLRYTEELSVEEISKVIDKTNGATRVILHRAMIALKTVCAQNHGKN